MVVTVNHEVNATLVEDRLEGLLALDAVGVWCQSSSSTRTH